MIAETPVGLGPAAISGDPATRTLYAANHADGDLPGTVSVIDLRRCQAADSSGCGQTWSTIATARSPFGAVVVPQTHRLIVTHIFGSAVSLIELRRCTGSDHRGCSATPKRIATGQITAVTRLDPLRHTGYVLNSADSTFNIIDSHQPCRTGLCFR